MNRRDHETASIQDPWPRIGRGHRIGGCAQIAVVPRSHRRGSSHPLKQRSISIRTRSFIFSKTTLVQSLAVGVAVKIRSQAQLGELTSRVRVVEGYYDLDTGKVAWTAK
jgi:hypothetical protein